MDVRGLEELGEREVLEAVHGGARLVVFQTTVSALLICFTQTSPVHLVEPGVSAARVGRKYSLMTFFLGWWSPWGLFYAPATLLNNLRGGRDVTEEVLAIFEAQLTTRQAAGVDRAALEEALGASPDDEDLRRRLAGRLLDDGDPDGAWATLRGVQPREDVACRRLFRRLVTAFQRRGQHEEALAVLEHVLRDVPRARRRSSFVGHLVRSSERMTGRPQAESLLPPPKLMETGAGGVLLLVALLLLLATIAVGANRWVRGHRTVFVVNGATTPASLSAPGVEEGRVLSVVPGGVRRITLAEGEHTFEVTRGGATRTVPVRFEQDFFRRFWPSLVVLNLDRAGAIVRHEAVYGDTDQQPDPPRFYVGGPLLVLPTVDHTFEPLPPSITARRGETRTLSAVELVHGPTSQVYDALAADVPPPELLDFLEARLLLEPEDRDAVTRYEALTDEAGEGERFAAFFADRLAARPVSLVWHTLAQERRATEGQALVEDYRRLLGEAPDDPRRLVLLARLLPALDEARALYARAVDGDASCVEAHRGLARLEAGRGRFEAALAGYRAAAAVRPRDPELADQVFWLRLALGDDALLSELEGAGVGHAADAWLARRLIGLRGARGELEAARAACDAFVTRFRHLAGGDPSAEGMITLARSWVADLVGDAEALLALAGETQQPAFGRELAVRAHLWARRPQEAEAALEELLALDPAPADFYAQLMSVAWAREGRRDEARRWAAVAADAWRAELPVLRRAAEILTAETPPDADELASLHLSRGGRLLLQAVLAGLHPEAAGPLLEEAERLAFVPLFPECWLRQALGDLRPE